jgi:hypothetical protein
MQLPARPAVEACLVAIFVTPAHLIPLVNKNFTSALGTPTRAEFPEPDLELATYAGKTFAAFICGDEAIPDTADFEDLMRPRIEESMSHFANLKGDKKDQIVIKGMTSFFSNLMDKGLENSPSVSETIERWRNKVLRVVEAAAQQGSTLATFLEGDTATARVARAAYTEAELRFILSKPFEVFTSPEELKKMFSGFAKEDFPEQDQTEIEDLIKQQIDEIVGIMRTALDGAVEQTVNSIYAN